MTLFTLRNVVGAALLAGVLGGNVLGVRIVHQLQVQTQEAQQANLRLTALLVQQTKAVHVETAQTAMHTALLQALYAQAAQRLAPLPDARQEGQSDAH